MAARAPQQGLTSQQKMIGAIAVIAAIIAIVAVYKVWAGTQVHVVRSYNLPVGSSEKMQAMKEQQGKAAGGVSPDDFTPTAAQKH